MADDPFEGRLAELRDTADAVGRLADEKEAFGRVVEAFRAQDVDTFRDVLGRFDLLDRCHLICRWLCSKHCVFVCIKLAGPVREAPTNFPSRRSVGSRLPWRGSPPTRPCSPQFVDVVDREDVDGFQALLKEQKLGAFAHQLCHWLCVTRCRFVCRIFCPPPPLITHVANIPVGQIDAQGYAAGGSQPVGYTPPDNKPAGVGDHPLAVGRTSGASSTSPTRRTISLSTRESSRAVDADQDRSVGRMLERHHGRRVFAGTGRRGLVPDRAPPPPCPPPGPVDQHGMGFWSMGDTYLTDWSTPVVPNDLYYLRLTVRTTTLVEHHSPVVPVRVDNVGPTQPVITLDLLKPDGTTVPLGCCETIAKEDGNKVIVTLQASDANFSQISVSLIGGCGVSLGRVDTGGTSLSKTYNGNLADTGYPLPASFIWDPFAAPAPDPCCYLVYVTITDRAIVNNFWSGGHSNVNWHSITIGG